MYCVTAGHVQNSITLIARESQESEDVLAQESSENDVFSRLNSALSLHDLPQICHAIGKVNAFFTLLCQNSREYHFLHEKKINALKTVESICGKTVF